MIEKIFVIIFIFYSPLAVSTLNTSNVDIKPDHRAALSKNLRKNTKEYIEQEDYDAILSIKGSLSNSTGNVNDTYDRIDLKELFEIWDPSIVAQAWNRDIPNRNISIKCNKYITDYLHEVSRGAAWALRMADASGKYSGGLFTNNKFWIGALDQCRLMDKGFTEWQRNKEFPRDINLPPFGVSVYGLNITIEILQPEINATHVILLGLCLPAACTTQDVQQILHFALNQSRTDLQRKVTLYRIRKLSGGYNFWDDPVFYVLLSTFIIVLVLVILCTLYDIALRYQVLRNKEESHISHSVIPELKTLQPYTDTNKKITISKLWAVKAHNDTLDVHNSKNTPRPLSEVLLSFSLLINLSKIGSLDVGSDTLAPIHGLRFFTMIWIILVHTCLICNELSDNKVFRMVAEEDFFYQTIGNGTYSVDTFFFMSGCLVSFLYFRTITKDKIKNKKILRGYFNHIFQFLGMVGYRYLRLTPPYLLVLGLIQVSSRWYDEHTIFDIFMKDFKNCDKYWWRNALYINTYFDHKERCMTWSWYLANDTQFFVVGTIILIISISSLPVAVFITAFFLTASWISTGIITWNTEYVPSIQDPFAHYESLYDKPWLRIGPYLIGMCVGWFLYKTDCKLKLNKAITLICWFLSLMTMTSIIYGLYRNKFGPILSMVHTSLSHSGWAVCIGWILIACVTDHGGPVNALLSWKYFYPLSRLSFCAYLVHPAILRAVLLQTEGVLHLSVGYLTFLFLGKTIASYVVALFISLLFEAPMVSLLRIVHPLRQWKSEK
ncbi:hypothetical protein KM043_017059 [Ampulex compressa]|nr:hypothetical protein KM043_017059 [Ampulex compressa]